MLFKTSMGVMNLNALEHKLIFLLLSQILDNGNNASLKCTYTKIRGHRDDYQD
jgi:hypothetical protein